MVLEHKDIALRLRRMACEIAEKHVGETKLVMVGMNERGSFIAKLLKKHILEFSADLQIDIVEVDTNNIVFKKDAIFLKVPIIIIDDVINSGKTALQVICEVFKFNPSKISTAFLAKREHSIFPVKTNFVGISISTTLKEHVYFDNANKQNLKVYLE